MTERTMNEESSCRDCGTTENIDETGLCAFCEEDEQDREQ